jgi:hypothetical protein
MFFIVFDVAYEVNGFTGQGDREYLLLSECVISPSYLFWTLSVVSCLWFIIIFVSQPLEGWTSLRIHCQKR